MQPASSRPTDLLRAVFAAWKARVYPPHGLTDSSSLEEVGEGSEESDGDAEALGRALAAMESRQGTR